MEFNITKFECRCGKDHSFDSAIIGEGVIACLPEVLSGWSAKRAFIYADMNTYTAAGQKVCDILRDADVNYKQYIFDKESLEPDEKNVGLAIMNFDSVCDVIIGVGSGVINDICKIVANVSGKKYIIVATAPSMDGFASATSSMTREGLKISLNSKCADLIIGDVDVLCNAPEKMLLSGLGDMLAKYISICEWRISHIINGEYYCEEIADLVRSSLKKCVDNADGLLKRDKEAVKAVFEGLIICGAAMKFAGLSRPASGIEHYLSHIWDMRGVEFGENVETHGLQCAVGTLISAKLYEKLVKITPDRQKALSYVNDFNFDDWSQELIGFLGKGSKDMIALEAKEKKYDKEKHAARLEIIIENWDEILQIISEEIPTVSKLEELYDRIGMPKSMSEIGIDESILPLTFKSAKDIRDKYVLPRLCWDLGIIDEII